jgi:hypothetical protein
MGHREIIFKTLMMILAESTKKLSVNLLLDEKILGFVTFEFTFVPFGLELFRKL